MNRLAEKVLYLYVIGSLLTKPTEGELIARNALFVMPESEKVPSEIIKTKKTVRASMLLGVAVTAILLIFWVVPYTTHLVR